jgi:mannosyltransferase
VPGWAYGLVLLLALVPRLFQATHTPFQFDEIQTLVLLRHSLSTVLASLHQTVDPPVHYVVLWLWRAVGGDGPLWLKALPIVFGLFTVLALLPMGRALFSARAGILGGALLAVNGTHIASSQNIRAYALSWLLLTLIVWLAWRWTLRSRLAESALMFALALTALYTDYYSVFVLFALALWGVLRMRNERRRLLMWIGLWMLVALAFAPHLPAMFGQLGRDVGGERWTLALSVSDLVIVTKSLAFGSVWLIPVLAVVAALPLQRPAQWKAASLLWFLVLLPTLVPWEMSAQGIHLFIARQMLYTLPLWCLLVGAGLAHMRRLRLAFFLGLGLVLFAAVTWLAQWRVVVA